MDRLMRGFKGCDPVSGQGVADGMGDELGAGDPERRVAHRLAQHPALVEVVDLLLVLLAAAITSLFVRRRLDRLDLVAVLKIWD